MCQEDVFESAAPGVVAAPSAEAQECSRCPACIACEGGGVQGHTLLAVKPGYALLPLPPAEAAARRMLRAGAATATPAVIVVFGYGVAKTELLTDSKSVF